MLEAMGVGGKDGLETWPKLDGGFGGLKVRRNVGLGSKGR